MILVRNTFQLRFGRTDQAVDLFRRMPEVAQPGAMPLAQYALTDIAGPMYTFVHEQVCHSLAEWEGLRTSFYEQSGFEAWFREFQLIVQSGHQEYFTIENEHAGWSQPGVIVVRETYRVLKWQIRSALGLLERYGALLTEAGVGSRPRLLTDLSGDMFRASVEVETPDLAQWERQRRDLYPRADFQAWFAQLSSNVEGGLHEFFRVELTQQLR